MNPFEKRATEYIRDPLAFLPYVTPEPLLTYLKPHAQQDKLYEKFVALIGSPGTGKTTLARLFVFPTLMALLRNGQLPSRASLMDALIDCKAIGPDSAPLLAGCRIPMESDYRECWELPYDKVVCDNLLFSLLQARAVLGWLRGFEEAGIELKDVTLIPRADASAALEAIGGLSIPRIRDVARQVERDVYGITASLMPPAADQLPVGATIAYRPLDVIEAFDVATELGQFRLKPLLICDDAHVLHPTQLAGLIGWLARREIRVARWMLTRVDALRPHDVLRPDSSGAHGGPGLSQGRDVVPVWMQSAGDRAARRRSFRIIAADMANRYLEQMPVFVRHRLTRLEDLLGTRPEPLTPAAIAKLRASLTVGQRKLVGPTRRGEIEALVDNYLSGYSKRTKREEREEVRLMMIRILMERYLRRVPQPSLFDELVDVVPSVPLRADASVRNAARMLLFHEADRPFFYGFDTLCDAASENAEKFLRLAGQLVATIETQIIRKREVALPASVQHKLLRARATQLLEEDDMPERARVIAICRRVADECLDYTRQPNAGLGEGPNAWGILQREFDAIPDSLPDLARVLQHGVANNMFTLVRDHGGKGELWCLVELSGSWSLASGLTLKRGQFLERTVEDLIAVLGNCP